RAHVGLIFLRQSFARRAMSPIKLAEYLASGLPVVMTPGVGDSEEDLLPHRVGVVVKEQSPEGCDRALEELLDLLAEGAVLRDRCRRVAERLFSLEAGVSEYEALYRSLLPSS
ncbi:MAG: glycosyltransferase, partial [Nitrospinota bacterium]